VIPGVSLRRGSQKWSKLSFSQLSLLLARLALMLRAMTDARRTLLRKLENVDAFPLIALQAVHELRADLDSVEAEAILRARVLGASLEDIADALEITRQGVAYKLKVLAGNGHGEAEDASDEIIDVRKPDGETQGSTSSS